MTARIQRLSVEEVSKRLAGLKSLKVIAEGDVVVIRAASFILVLSVDYSL